VRSERWRYISYEDGGEELYDHTVDSNEWTNLATNANYDAIKERLRAWLPEMEVPEWPGREN
jgi:iduronate 2-sulfatase